jgi:hypothetical protein
MRVSIITGGGIWIGEGVALDVHAAALSSLATPRMPIAQSSCSRDTGLGAI